MLKKSSNENFFIWFIFLLIADEAFTVSFNQPKLCPNATWNPNAITFANNITLGGRPRGIYIDINDRIFFAAYSKRLILVWFNSSTNWMRNLTASLSNYTTLFATVNGDIYFENSSEVGRIDKLELNGTSSEFVTKFSGSCYGLFIDINNTLYCSVEQQNQVISVSLNNDNSTFITVAGDGNIGMALNELYNPWGIFVDVNFDLYVADAGNGRIQLFQQGQLNGIIVAGVGIPNNLALNLPTDVVLDADNYLFIADNMNYRIIRVGPTNYYCVAGCSNLAGTAPNQLDKPISLRFDSQANIYVADEYNYRIQKFMLVTNSCDISTITMSTIDFETTTPTQSSSSSYSFIPSSCRNQTYIGINCNISSTICNMSQPCQNNGTCKNVNTTLLGYLCSCPSGFNGSQCQFDYRPCKPNTCWNNGICENISDSIFICQCVVGWQGIYCETMINYCENITCFNGGICQPLLRDYECKCLGDSFSGRYYEITNSRIRVYQKLGKSFAYVAIITMISAGMFIVIMDILKYCFGIDVTGKYLKKIQRKKRSKKRRPPVIIRFKYVN